MFVFFFFFFITAPLVGVLEIIIIKYLTINACNNHAGRIIPNVYACICDRLQEKDAFLTNLECKFYIYQQIASSTLYNMMQAV